MFASARLFASRHFVAKRPGLAVLASLLRAVFEPRKPRHRVLRLLLGLAGIVLLSVLVVAGVAVGAVMLATGLAYRLLGGGSRRAVKAGRVMDGQYRVVARPALPASR